MNETRPAWDVYFLLLARLVASRSTCNRRHCGAVIVRDRQILATGYNGAMPGVPHCRDRRGEDGQPYCHRRHHAIPEALKVFGCVAGHAEVNAIALAARHGISLNGAVLYSTHHPCSFCLKAICMAGIGAVVYEFSYPGLQKTGDCGISVTQMRLGDEVQTLAEVLTHFDPYPGRPTHLSSSR